MRGTQETDVTVRARLAQLMDERRVQLGLTWNQVADRASLTKEGLRTVRQGTRKIMPLTKWGIELALHWQSGSVDSVLDRGDPTPLPAGDVKDSTDGPDAEVARAGSAPAPWIATALDGEESSAEDLRPAIDLLRKLGERSGYTLGETLLESGLAAAADLAVRRSVAAPGDTPEERYQAQVRQIMDDPNLSRGEKRDMIGSLKKLREALGLTQPKGK